MIKGRNIDIKAILRGKVSTPKVADYLFLGERPGKEEDRYKSAFVGPAGEILQTVVDELDLDKLGGYWIDNQCPTYHPTNKKPTKVELEQFIPRLSKMIEVIDPRYIILLGVTAIKGFTYYLESLGINDVMVYKNIEKYIAKGSVVVNNRTVIFTYHPSVVLQKADGIGYRNLIRDHIQQVINPVITPTELKLADDQIVIDLEWDNTQQAVEIGTYGMCYEYAPFLYISPQDTWYELVIGHGFKADLKIKPELGYGKGIVDTMLMHNIVEETYPSLKLKTLAKKYLNVDLDKDKRENLFDLPYNERRDYNYQDVISTGLIFNILKEKLSNPEKRYLLRQGEMSKLLAKIENRGVRIDLTEFARIKGEYEKRISLVKFPFNPNSSKQVTAYFKSKNAQIKTLENNPEAKDLIDYKHLVQRQRMYINTYEELLQGDHIYPQYPLTSQSGRLRSAKPNFQQLPKDKEDLLETIPLEINPKRFIIPEEGYQYLLKGDLQGAELNYAANISGDPVMLYELAHGDLHNRTKEELGLPNRTIAKNINFGLLYGGSFWIIKDYSNCSKAVAEERYDAHRQLYKKYWEWYDEQFQHLLKHGWVMNEWGRKRHWLNWLDPKSKLGRSYARSCLNTLIQGPVAEVIKDLMMIFDAQGWYVYANVHDEIILCVKDKEAIESAKNLYNNYTKAQKTLKTFKLPLTIEWKVGETL